MRENPPPHVGGYCILEPAFAGILLSLFAGLFSATAGGLPTLPPPANLTVDFDRDVRPLLERSCLRCHGAEKPKSHFSLDNREAALKGGRNNTNDIVPGDSAHSLLIQYVARVDEDMEMPPPGKGDPLTAEQVGILRAWIDQGARWGIPEVFPKSSAVAAPVFRWFSVSGDQNKFRELEGFKNGAGGGLEYFSLEQQDAPGQVIRTEGHVLVPEKDLEIKLTATRKDFGFVHAGGQRWTRYYDDTGGFYSSFTPPSFDLNRDLHLDIGRAWIDFGLTLPDWPQVVLGYEYQARQGAKSMLEWGPVTRGTNTQNIYPAAKDIDERVHILKLDVTHDIQGWRFEDNARAEFYQNDTTDRQVTSFTTGPAPDAIVTTVQNFSHIQAANTLRVEKQLTAWWFGSAGYFYSWFDGDSSMNQSTADSLNAPTFGTYWHDQVTLHRDSHIFSVASSFVPFEGLSLSVASQNEFTRQDGFGDIGLDAGNPTIPGLFFTVPATVNSDLDETKTSQTVALRFTKIPYTVLFADGQFAQDGIAHFEEEVGATSPDAFTLDTDYNNRLQDLRAGFDTSPWQWGSWSAHYRYRDSDSDYDHPIDTAPGYPGFIRHRKIQTDEAETRLTLRPVYWFKASLGYQWTSSEYSTATDPLLGVPFFGDISPGGGILAGRYRANIYSVSATWIPAQRFYFTGLFSYSDSRTETWAQQNGGPVVPYAGDIYSVMASANYALNSRTALKASYAFSRGAFGQNNAGGLPLGLDYTQHGLAAGISREWSSRVSTSLRYQFYQYHEPSTGSLNDFTAHGVFATVTLKWP